MNRLQEVSLCSTYPNTNIPTNDIPIEKTNSSVKHLSIGFMRNGGQNQFVEFVESALNSLFQCFVGMTHFEFEDRNPISVDWECLFATLLQRKVDYSRNNDRVTALQSVELNGVSIHHAEGVIDALRRREHEAYYDLNRFVVHCVAGGLVSARDWLKFVKDHLRPFLKGSKNDRNLRHLGFGYGVPYRWYHHQKHQWFELPRSVHWRDRGPVFSSELELLFNLPSGLVSLELVMPQRYILQSICEDTSIRGLVSALCRLLMEKEQHSIQSISMKGVKLEKEWQQYLIYFFGYQDRLRIDRKSYCLFFND